MPTPRLAAFLVPPITVVTFVYQAIASLHITVLRRETLVVCASALAVGVAAGAVAAFGVPRLRAVVLGITLLFWIDLSVGLADVFAAWTPEARAVRARDRVRVQDVQRIRTALDAYLARRGRLPSPAEYGEGIGPQEFWEGWWDVSSEDTNGDGQPFLEFLSEAGVLPTVPVDPVNRGAADRHPARGQHYAFTVVPAGYSYEGGVCLAYEGRAMYLLAITDLEGESGRPPASHAGSGCECLWRSRPRFFEQHFDYVICGQADRKPTGQQDGLQ